MNFEFSRFPELFRSTYKKICKASEKHIVHDKVEVDKRAFYSFYVALLQWKKVLKNAPMHDPENRHIMDGILAGWQIVGDNLIELMESSSKFNPYGVELDRIEADTNEFFNGFIIVDTEGEDIQ